MINLGSYFPLIGKTLSGAINRGAVAANHSMVQLWNPLANDQVVVLRRIVFWSTSGNTGFSLQKTAAALATLGAAPVNRDFSLSGGTNAEIRSGVAAALPGTELDHVFQLANRPFWIDLSLDPIQIPPGTGFLIGNSTQNANVTASFSWAQFAA